MAEQKQGLYDFNLESWNKLKKQIYKKLYDRECEHIMARVSIVNDTIKQGIQSTCNKYKMKILKEFKRYEINFDEFTKIFIKFMSIWEPRLPRNKRINNNSIFKKARGWYDQNKHKLLGKYIWKPVFIYIETYANAFMDCIHINVPNLSYTMYYLLLIQIIINILDLEIKLPGIKKQSLINHSIIIKSNELIKYFKIITGNRVDISLWYKESNNISSTELKRSNDVQIVYGKFYSALRNILNELQQNFKFYQSVYGKTIHLKMNLQSFDDTDNISNECKEFEVFDNK